MDSESSRDLKQRAIDLLLFLPRLAKLLGRLAADPEVSGKDKAIVLASLAYVASPIDLIPDFIPILGEIDDIYIVSLTILRLLNRVGAKKLQSYWDGPEDIIALVQKVSDVATALLPEKVRRLIVTRLDDAEGGKGPGDAGPGAGI